MRIVGIMLMSKFVYEMNRDVLSDTDFIWMAAGTDMKAEFMGASPEWIEKAGTEAYYDEYDVRPVMIFDRIPYERGSKIEYAGIRWTVYSDREMLADESIGKCRLVERSWQIKKGRPLTVLEIKCLFLAENWQINHAKDPLFLLEGEDRIPIPMEYGYANGGI